ncbi:MAG: hypothetical protein JJU13_17875 [Balneolaceae bacterium]|nr:hypothetical protein [Balneolaceae bacterium]
MGEKRDKKFLLFLFFLSNIFTLLPVYLVAQESDDKSSLNIGGALRYNIILQSYENDIDATSSAFTMDTWRINILYDNPGGFGLNFEYRFYPTFGTHFIKQGWLDYHFSERTELQVGVTQVPFGNLQYNSNNWWFSLPYYVGLEDDHDMGIKLTHRRDSYQWDFAYFFQPEPEGPPEAFGTGGPGRYSYDVIPKGNASLKERNQINIRGAYQFDGCEFGASLQFGQLYSLALDQFDSRYAFAVHADINSGNFNIKPQFLYYGMNAFSDEGHELSTVFLGAYGVPYQVSTEARIVTLGMAYSYDVDWGPITNLLFYNDFSYMHNSVGKGITQLADGTSLTLSNNFENTIKNIIGILMSAGPVFTYFDIAQGINHPWLSETFGTGVGPGH